MGNAPCSKRANPLAERCGVSNKQQWTGNPRFLIGFRKGSPGLSRSSALSRLLWIPVRLWPPRKALETVAALSGFAHWQGTHVVVPCSSCTLTKSCSAGTHPSPGSLKVDARGALTSLWASNVCPGRLHFSHDEAQSGFVINHALSRRVWSARSARSHFDVSTMFHLRKETFT